MRAGRVYYKGRFAGLLQEHEGGFCTFTYDALYRIDGYPIAFTMPLSGEPYITEGLPPFFENLLSEGWLRRIQATTQHIDERDSFGLLLNNGRDMVGAVTVLPVENVK